MSSTGPDLFVICKKCGSEVSPYITECPYCGTRLRKRAQLDRDGRGTEKPPRPSRRTAPSLGRLRRGEIPGIRADRRPYATLAIVVASLLGALLWRTTLVALPDLAVQGRLDGEWWRLITSPLVYQSTGYALIALVPIGIFGWLLERRHGPVAVLLLFVLGGAGGMLLALGVESDPVALGGNGVALALLVAWAIPDLRDLRGGIEVEADMLGVAVFAAVLLLAPLAVGEADPLVGLAGALAGALVGVALTRLRPEA